MDNSRFALDKRHAFKMSYNVGLLSSGGDKHKTKYKNESNGK
jgi:hypothetical protein